ncbi:MAG: hypothetical protein AAGG51_20235, partial [Cyanobacteria bacterium P01_G01_bin.54]
MGDAYAKRPDPKYDPPQRKSDKTESKQFYSYASQPLQRGGYPSPLGKESVWADDERIAEQHSHAIDQLQFSWAQFNESAVTDEPAVTDELVVIDEQSNELIENPQVDQESASINLRSAGKLESSSAKQPQSASKQSARIFEIYVHNLLGYDVGGLVGLAHYVSVHFNIPFYEASDAVLATVDIRPFIAEVHSNGEVFEYRIELEEWRSLSRHINTNVRPNINVRPQSTSLIELTPDDLVSRLPEHLGQEALGNRPSQPPPQPVQPTNPGAGSLPQGTDGVPPREYESVRLWQEFQEQLQALQNDLNSRPPVPQPTSEETQHHNSLNALGERFPLDGTPILLSGAEQQDEDASTPTTYEQAFEAVQSQAAGGISMIASRLEGSLGEQLIEVRDRLHHFGIGTGISNELLKHLILARQSRDDTAELVRSVLGGTDEQALAIDFFFDTVLHPTAPNLNVASQENFNRRAATLFKIITGEDYDYAGRTTEEHDPYFLYLRRVLIIGDYGESIVGAIEAAQRDAESTEVPNTAGEIAEPQTASVLTIDQTEPIFEYDGTQTGIVVSPTVSVAVPGTRMEYTAVFGQDSGFSLNQADLDYFWKIEYDTGDNRPWPTREKSEIDGRSYRITMPEAEGTYTIIVEVRDLNLGRDVIGILTYTQVVKDPTEHISDLMRQMPPIAPAPELYVSNLEVLKWFLPETDTTGRAAIEERQQQAEALLINESRSVVPLAVMLVPTEDPQPQSLEIYARQDSRDQVTLLDFKGVAGKVRQYKGSASNINSSELPSIRAFKDAWRRYVQNSDLPEGKVAVDPPQELGFPYSGREPLIANTNGRASLEDLLRGISNVSGIAALALLPVGFVFPPAFAGVKLLTYISATTGGAAAALNIADRLKHGDFAWDRETAWDLTEIVAALALGGSLGLELTGVVTEVKYVRGAYLVTHGAELAGDGTAALLITEPIYNAILEVQRDNSLSNAQKIEETGDILLQAAPTGGLLLLMLLGAGGGVPTGKPDLNRVNSITSGLSDRTLAREIANSTELQQALHNEGYQMQQIQAAWNAWQQGQTGYQSTSFTEYVKHLSNIRTQGLLQRTDLTLQEYLGDNWVRFSQLGSPRNQNLFLLEITEKTLADTIKQQKLPPHIQGSVDNFIDQSIFFNSRVNGDLGARHIRSSLSGGLNRAIGESIQNITEFKAVIELVSQRGNRGAIGERYFAARHATSELADEVNRKPQFLRSEVPGMKASQLREPDRIRP